MGTWVVEKMRTSKLLILGSEAESLLLSKEGDMKENWWRQKTPRLWCASKSTMLWAMLEMQ